MSAKGLADLKEEGFLINRNANIGWNMKKYHFHDFYEINYSLSDNVNFFVGDRIYPVQRGTLFVFNTMDLHRSVSSDGAVYERYVVYFNPEFVQDLCTPQTNLLDCFVNRGPGFSHCVRLSAEQSKTLLSLFDKAEKYYSAGLFGRDVYKKIVLAEILLYVNSLFRNPAFSYPAGDEKGFNRIVPVLQFIQTHLGEDLSLERLAGAFYISKYHLGALFKKATGFTVNEYIINRRVLKARELLKKGFPVQRAGEMVGFNNPSHFIRTFKKLVGLPPKQYVKKRGD
ncbi:MAG: AraC family transcriptional regulator [Peptococcaceae bacterium]|nr:AraC family transcriptional regulator [Peptococcaceae bacterium]MDH7526092.1 AraC family transcriptional regulator [Peptococcaceae bacterium]